MLELAQFIWRNPQVLAVNPKEITQAARKANKTVKAMRTYRQAAKAKGLHRCSWCGKTKSIHIHHIYPVSRFPDMADDTGNMICLCAKCHHRVGHGGNWKWFVRNVDDMCRIRQLFHHKPLEKSYGS